MPTSHRAMGGTNFNCSVAHKSTIRRPSPFSKKRILDLGPFESQDEVWYISLPTQPTNSPPSAKRSPSHFPGYTDVYSRREFLRLASLAGGATALNADVVFTPRRTTEYFGLNEFVESHPEAVFILKTAIASKTNASDICDVGHQFGQSLFVAKSDAEGNFPTAANVAIKPNLTSWSWDKTPVEQTMGIQTDANFVEGVMKSLREIQIDAGSIYIRDGNFSDARQDGALYRDLANRTGVDLKDLGRGVGSVSEEDLQWVDVPDGIFFKRIAYLWPVNSAGSCLINIAKFKSHSMGMTLCSKNLQGTNAQPYIAHCTAWGSAMRIDANHVVSNAFNTIQANYERHKNAGIPRWDLPGTSSGGLWMETHSSRCLDNNAVLHPLINIVEGIYGREGPFVSGPADNGGYGKDLMTNLVIFGRNARHVDIIGTYLAGHEPGNFGFFHLAVERKLAATLNPHDLSLYEWKPDGSATPSTLGDFTRTPIRTLYLRKAGEEQYHMVNEAYDYTGQTPVSVPRQRKPDVFTLSQNFPNPFNPSTSIQYYIPRSGHVFLEVFNIRGERVAVLVDANLPAGDHVVTWNARSVPSGTYVVRFLYGGQSLVRKLLFIR